MGKKVFLSVSNGYRKDQIMYEKELREMITKLTCTSPITVSCLCNKGEAPLIKVIDSIKNCDALIALAFERKHTYMEFQKEKNLFERIEKSNIYYTSPWIHIECAIAQALGKPILILLPSNIEQEGVIDLTQDVYKVIHIPIISKGQNNWCTPEVVKFNSPINRNCINEIKIFLKN